MKQAESDKTSRAGAAIELYGVYFVEEESADEHDAGDRPFFTLACYLSAEDAQLSVRGRDYYVTAGQVVLLPPGVSCRRRARRDARIVLQFSSPGLSETPCVLTREQSLALVPQFSEIRRVWRERAIGFKYRALAGVARLLADLPTERPHYTALVSQALSIMESSYTDPDLSVAEVAAALGVSGTYLRRVFTKEVGSPPKQYLSALRFDRANALLFSRLLSVAEAAEASGFRPGSNFSTAYRHYFGHSPTEPFKKSDFS